MILDWLNIYDDKKITLNTKLVAVVVYDTASRLLPAKSIKEFEKNLKQELEAKLKLPFVSIEVKESEDEEIIGSIQIRNNNAIEFKLKK
jgi:hypothetical protein